MTLYLLRHAEAERSAPTDALRVLTPKGIDQSTTVAKFCKQKSLRPDLILTSPFRRALQTAEIVAARLDDIELLHQGWLACGMQPARALAELRNFRDRDSVMIVGHEPDFSELAACLLGLPHRGRLHVRKASLTAIDSSDLKPGTGTLEFCVPVKLL